MEPILRLEEWFRSRGWAPFEFQKEVWQAYLNGESGLIHSATGTGKTLGAWLGPLAEWMRENPDENSGDHAKKRADAPGLRVLWITPLRALAADTELSLKLPLEALGIYWTVEIRTGDTSQSLRKRQAEQLPTALITTPESLILMLMRKDSDELLRDLRCIVVDEWHELLSTKRGVQTELALARVRRIKPGVKTWGVSATLGNLEGATESLLGAGVRGTTVLGHMAKEIVIDSVLPKNITRFPWSGHFGTSMIPAVVEAIDGSGTCLIFTNTRSQTEIWHQQILARRPEWRDQVGIHHGSLDRETRDKVENDIKTGKLRAVVCTSSLDLGVDFSPVDRVLQVGSPKGVARLLQRAGRSGHRPGVPSRVTCVPTHAFELVDIASAREAALDGRIERRENLSKPLDVLSQHLVSIAVGPGFRPQELLEEVRTTVAYQDLTDEEWEWVLDFVVRGGETLRAYPAFRRVVMGVDGVYRVEDRDIAQRHRLTVGTIMSDMAMSVQLVHGARLGTVEESFLSRLSPGDRFMFAGRIVEFVQIRDMTAWVRKATNRSGVVPRWAGGRVPLTTELSHAIRQELEHVKYGDLRSPEMHSLEPILVLQAKWSAIPAEDELLIERVETSEGHHLFFYPFEGRLVHEGLAALFAYRISQRQRITFSIACNDYGLELLAPKQAWLEDAIEDGLFSDQNLASDIVESLNASEMAKRQFREVARIAGLVFQGYPWMTKSAKQVQATSGLFFDVFARYDPKNMLLQQAEREVLERQLEQSRMGVALRRLQQAKLLITEPPKPTPMAFPILVDRLRGTITSEHINDRIEKMSLRLEKEADLT
ncbi:MAG: ligase-associated DNA damage response DEXH box helicase [Fimbriimonas sp.]|nr:ligase-associated DNA damage response DEXH box helicase [Fimbriimonas sp.]